ncbi:MAG: hybrid sensor histidine kinase/response regulator [Chloroflexota bacterium]
MHAEAQFYDQIESGDHSLIDELPAMLVVDDTSSTRLLFRHLFEESFRVTAVESGSAALEMLKAQHFDVMLLDLVLSDMDGLTVLQRVRNCDSLRYLPVILVSALSDNTLVARGLSLGANDFITKPINRTVALARIRAQITMMRAVEERDRAATELKHLKESHERLLRMAAHDLRAPLLNIRMAETALRHYLQEDIAPVGAMLQAIGMLQDMMEDFLNAFSVTQLEYQYEPVHIQRILNTLALQYHFGAASKGIEIEVAPGDLVVVADSARMAQAIGNLVSNAVKYSPPNSRISIGADLVDVDDGSGLVCVYVQDEGPGIPEAEQHLLFTEFGKLSTRPTGNETSTGLGLWIVKSLIEGMNGTVGVDAVTEGGSRFWVRLPSAPASQD